MAAGAVMGSAAAWARLRRELVFGLEPIRDRVAGGLALRDLICALGDRIVARLRGSAACAGGWLRAL